MPYDAQLKGEKHAERVYVNLISDSEDMLNVHQPKDSLIQSLRLFSDSILHEDATNYLMKKILWQ